MKYIYNTSKEELDPYDSTSDYTILITETYRDDSLNRPSNKYTVLFTVIGTLIGVAIDAIMALLVFYNLDTTKAYIDKLMQEVKSNKKTIEQAKKELIELKNKVNEIDKEKNELKSKYGISSKDIKLRLKQ